MKSKKYTIFSLIVVVFGLFALTACGTSNHYQTIEEELKNNDWQIIIEESEMPIKFKADGRLLMGTKGEEDVYSYRFLNGGKQLEIDHKNIMEQKEKFVFNLNKVTKGFELSLNEKLTNDTAKVNHFFPNDMKIIPQD